MSKTNPVDGQIALHHNMAQNAPARGISMTELTVIVDGERVPVCLLGSRNVRTARGEYRGRIIEAEGRRDRLALAQWCEIAARRAAMPQVQ